MTVEFQPGDVIEIKGPDEVRYIAVQCSSTLEGMSAYFQQLLTWLATDGGIGSVGNKHGNPKLPPPPPVDGAWISKPKSGAGNGITLVFGQ